MFEKFHVSHDIAVRVQGDAMHKTVMDIFINLGAPEPDARRSADCLMYADLRGIDSHGVSNMMRSYVTAVRNGTINLAPVMKVVRDAPAVATLDSDEGLGLTIGPQAMEMAMDKAEKYGMGSVSVTNGRHFGAAAYHAALALDRDMIGMAMTQGGIYMAPTYGAEGIVGVNPIALAAPGRNEAPFVFDASTSSIAMNKIVLARRNGVKVLPGWIAEQDGTPIMDERDVPDEFLMLPVGGTREIGSHKAYSHAVMIDILSGMLSGGGPGFLRREGICHHFVAYKIEAFVDLDIIKDDMDIMLKKLRESKTAPGHDRVYYAGLPEHEAYQERSVEGIPYHPEVVEWFHTICKELGVTDSLGV